MIKDFFKAIGLRAWLMLAVMVWMTAMSSVAHAQQPYSPERGPQQWDQRNHYPRWCRNYDRRDYYREMRACGDDRRCRRDVRRKGERCGIS